MCEFSGRLVAWLDGELQEPEATNVAWHLARCAECRETVQSFQAVSSAFLSCYEQALPRPVRRPRWIFVAGGTAAAAVLAALLLWPRPLEPLPIYSVRTPQVPAVAFLRPTSGRSRTVSRIKQIRNTWTSGPPVVEVELPADMLFPPGAVPEGFSFIADVRTEP